VAGPGLEEEVLLVLEVPGPPGRAGTVPRVLGERLVVNGVLAKWLLYDVVVASGNGTVSGEQPERAV